MNTQFSTADIHLQENVQPAKVLLTIRYADPDCQATIAGIIMSIAKSEPWLKQAISTAFRRQETEEQAFDAWVDQEEARHADPYGLSKEGDGVYWTQT
jgi:hypothetical protein